MKTAGLNALTGSNPVPSACACALVFAGTATSVVTHNSLRSPRVRRRVATRRYASAAIEYKIERGTVILEGGLRGIDRAAIESRAKPRVSRARELTNDETMHA